MVYDEYIKLPSPSIVNTEGNRSCLFLAVNFEVVCYINCDDTTMS